MPDGQPTPYAYRRKWSGCQLPCAGMSEIATLRKDYPDQRLRRYIVDRIRENFNSGKRCWRMYCKSNNSRKRNVLHKLDIILQALQLKKMFRL